MGTVVEKSVTMGADEWREAGMESRRLAVTALHNQVIINPGSRHSLAAQCLRDADTFFARANMCELTDEPDTATVDVWDLSDEAPQ